MQLGSTHRPSSQTKGSTQSNSATPQRGTQTPCKQTRPSPQRTEPSSTTPSQSLSRLSQRSALAATCGLQTIAPPVWHWVMPPAQTPGFPVSQGAPPPSQVTPLMRKTLSLKSPSFPCHDDWSAPSQSSNAR